MTAIGPANARTRIVVDPAGSAVADPATFIVSEPRPLSRDRLVWALPLNQPGAVTKRYQPDHPATESCYFGMDFSMIVPFGVGLLSGTLAFYRNLVPPVPSNDWTAGPVEVWGRALYAQLTGGVPGTDYRLVWSAADTAGGVWTRTALCLCADTS